MKPNAITTLLPLLLLPLSLAQKNSEAFSQFFGAATLTMPNYSGDSSTLQAISFTGCTNYAHALQPFTAIPTGSRDQLEQVQVDGVCQLCASLSLTRVDSCCGVETSVACFEAFATGGSTPAKTTAAAKTTATSTSASSAAAGTKSNTPSATGASAPTSTSKSSSDTVSPVSPFIMAVLGFIQWAL